MSPPVPPSYGERPLLTAAPAAAAAANSDHIPRLSRAAGRSPVSVRARSSVGVENVRLPVDDVRASLGRPSRYDMDVYAAPQTMRRPPRFPPRPVTGARKWTRISHVRLGVVRLRSHNGEYFPNTSDISVRLCGVGEREHFDTFYSPRVGNESVPFRRLCFPPKSGYLNYPVVQFQPPPKKTWF